VTRAQLEQLALLADLRARRSAARLARRRAALTALERHAAALGAPAAPAPGDVQAAMAADRHDVWRAARLAELAPAIARAHAEAQPWREAHARDTARQLVLARLAARAGR
jgi:hypothetical protein